MLEYFLTLRKIQTIFLLQMCPSFSLVYDRQCSLLISSFHSEAKAIYLTWELASYPSPFSLSHCYVCLSYSHFFLCLYFFLNFFVFLFSLSVSCSLIILTTYLFFFPFLFFVVHTLFTFFLSPSFFHALFLSFVLFHSSSPFLSFFHIALIEWGVTGVKL